MDESKTGAVLIVPACDKDRGGGHLNRSLFLLRALEEGGSREGFLWISERQKDEVFRRFRNFFEASGFSRGFHARLLSGRNELTGRDWDFIVLDRFRTPPKEFAFWSSLGPVIGIDEGGPCRKHFDFLADLLPALKGHEPNLVSPGLLPLPKTRRSPVRGKIPGKSAGPLRVLISFGAEDSSGLGLSAARILSSSRLSPNAPGPFPEITLVSPRGVPHETEQKLPGVKVRGMIPNLREHMAEYDLLITHFGLGAFEAVYARVPVLLISPTSYHGKLAQNAGFYSLGKGQKFSLGPRFLKALEARRSKIARRFGLEEEQKEDLGSFFGGINPHTPGVCPVCEENAVSENAGPVLARSPEETYRRCRKCGVIYLSRLNPPPIAYNEEYFFDFYKKQYGKTYIEDFPNLMAMGYRRLKHIRKILTVGEGEGELKPRLLDIGCAYGAFMAAAAESGFSPCGVDPVEGAVEYVNEELQLPAWQGFFPTGAKAEDGPFDVVSLWYVIEHFTGPGRVLKEIHRLLREGGVLAFSTPSFSGISGRKRLGSFLKNSPPDHWTVWSPAICKKIFRQYGFRLRKIVVTGHHPKRFPFLGRFVRADNQGMLYNLLFLASRIFRLGDTFEAYAEKIQ